MGRFLEHELITPDKNPRSRAVMLAHFIAYPIITYDYYTIPSIDVLFYPLRLRVPLYSTSLAHLDDF
jgi:hypothetical protein